MSGLHRRRHGDTRGRRSNRGSIAETNYQVYFTAKPEAAGAMLAAALQQVGVGVARTERADKPDQLRPAHDGPLLGRALLALGCEVGATNAESAPLPAWLLDTSVDVRRPCARLFAMYRATTYDSNDTLAIYNLRSRAYRGSVARLFDGVVDGAVTVRDYTVTISAEAARELGLGREIALREPLE